MLSKIKNILLIIILLPFALVFFILIVQAGITGVENWNVSKSDSKARMYAEEYKKKLNATKTEKSK